MDGWVWCAHVGHFLCMSFVCVCGLSYVSYVAMDVLHWIDVCLDLIWGFVALNVFMNFMPWLRFIIGWNRYAYALMHDCCADVMMHVYLNHTCASLLWLMNMSLANGESYFKMHFLLWFVLYGYHWDPICMICIWMIENVMCLGDYFEWYDVSVCVLLHYYGLGVFCCTIWMVWFHVLHWFLECCRSGASLVQLVASLVMACQGHKYMKANVTFNKDVWMKMEFEER